MRITIASSQAIEIGRKGENNVNKVIFPVYGWAELYGDGAFSVIHQRCTDNDPYPVVTTTTDKFVEWVITSTDVDVVGKGKCELRYIDSNGMRVKSVVYETITRDSLGNNSLEPPEPWETWVDNVVDAGTNALEAADAAQGYAEAAQEAATNAESAVSTAFGQITASATTLAPGSSATASFNPTSKVLSLGIPRGADGSGGGGGEANVIESISYNSTPLSITNKNVELKPTIDSAIAGKENVGKIKISGTEYTVTRKALAITENGVTTTYYVADIT